MKPAFPIASRVFHRLDPESEGIVTGILWRASGFAYYVTWSDREESMHFDIELTTEKEFGA